MLRRRVARIHAPDVRAERDRIAVRVHLAVVEVVVALQVGAERRVVLLGRQHERRAAAPAAHQLRRDQLLLLRRLAVLAEELAERADVLLELAVGEIAAVAGQASGLRQRTGEPVSSG